MAASHAMASSINDREDAFEHTLGIQCWIVGANDLCPWRLAFEGKTATRPHDSAQPDSNIPIQIVRARPPRDAGSGMEPPGTRRCSQESSRYLPRCKRGRIHRYRPLQGEVLLRSSCPPHDAVITRGREHVDRSHQSQFPDARQWPEFVGAAMDLWAYTNKVILHFS